jgi:hypothetical protein
MGGRGLGIARCITSVICCHQFSSVCVVDQCALVLVLILLLGSGWLEERACKRFCEQNRRFFQRSRFGVRTGKSAECRYSRPRRRIIHGKRGCQEEEKTTEKEETTKENYVTKQIIKTTSGHQLAASICNGLLSQHSSSYMHSRRDGQARRQRGGGGGPRISEEKIPHTDVPI